MTDRLQRSFESLQRATAEQVAGIDLRAGVLAAIDEPKPEPERRSRRWSWALVPALAAAAASAFLLWPGSGSSVEVSSSEPMTAVVGGERRVVAGERVELPTPVQLIASAGSGATVHAGAEIRLWPGAAVRAIDPSHFADLAGGASFESPDAVSMAISGTSITARGAFELETHRPGAPLTLTRNHKIAGAVVIAAVVTAGWIEIKTGQSSERIDAPGAAVVDDDGAVTRLDPADWKRRRGATDSTAAAAGDSGASPVSGAYWDDDEQRIIFALAGEVFDGVTGEPVTGFDVEARPIESKGFGKVGVVNRSVASSANGAFELNNLGLGTWRVTVRAADYAPSTQTVDLGDLHANPLLQFPLTEGAQITGEVVDWRGKPVEGAAVGQPECHRAEGKPGCALVASDASGRFNLPALPSEQVFALRAEHPRYGFSETKNLVQKPGETRHVVIALSGVVRIFGEVSRGEASAPVEGATVASSDGGTTATTDSAGHYEMLVPLTERPAVHVIADPARPGAVKIASYPDNRSSWSIKWVSDDTHVGEVEIDFRLQMEKATIRGRLTDQEGEPIAGAKLRFTNTAGWKRRGHETFPTETTTGGDGRYRLRDVPARAGYQVHALFEDQLTKIGYVTVADEVDVEANFTLGSGTIRGAFRTDTNKPFIAGANGCRRLGARGRANVHHTGRCLDDGRFEFTGLPPGTYTLENRMPVQDSPIDITPTSGIEVSAGAVVDGVVVVVSGQEARRWKLRVLDAGGRFVPGGFTRYYQGTTSFTSNLRVGDDGIAEISLGKLVETLFIDAPGYKSANVDLSGRDPGQVIVVRMERER